MADVLARCPHCGYQKRVSEYTVGMTDRCPQCGKALPIAPENVSPLEPGMMDAVELPGDENRQPGARRMNAQTAADRAASGRCARCGRAFRGDWDRVETDQGIVCNICANLATADAPHRVEQKPVPERDTGPEPPEPEPEKPGLGKRWQDFTETQQFRKALWIASGLILFLCVIMFFEGGPPAPEPGRDGLL